MNVDEARVPNVDPDWSIEIFLFSNGQKLSPPRKYYLQTDELNSWEATLNHLATSHYGPQCPPISLFTTDGQLVEGPLGLNGGQAYVAVVEPDTFVDTGYQEYLIRASRSWEKRHARKKVRECVPGDPCCLCPEKEYSYSQHLFLPVNEHTELRPADGHYMSSTPKKPVITGEYGFRSGGIGPTTGEHEVRSGEYETNPGEYGYSPVPTPGKPDQYAVGLSVNGANPCEQAPKLSGVGPRPGKYKAISDESGTKLDENTGRPGEYEVNLSDHAARFNESGAEPGEYGAKLNKHGFSLSQNGERPVEYLTTLSENEPRLSKDVVKPGAYGARPSENVPRPADYETRPSRNGARPGAYKPKPIENGATPDKHGAKRGEYTTPNKKEARPGEHGAKPGEYKSRPSVNIAKPREYVPRASEYKTRSNTNGDKPEKYAARPSGFETRLSVNGVRPGEHEARPGEHETRPSINRAKPGDSGARPGKNEVWSGEDVVRPTFYGSRAEIQHTRRISRQRSTENQQGGRTGEPTREFEHGSRVSEQKGGESNLAGRAGGQRVRENGVRLSEQRNKLSDLLPRLDGRESKLGDLETRPDDHGLRAIDHDTSLGNPASRVTEPSSRTAPTVYRPSHRDRINSRVRTSDLGQPKSRIPTRLDETAARLDDSRIKNTVGHPGAKPGSARGPAVADALPISDAHARSSSLFAGRLSTEKKRLPIGQSSSLPKKPTLISSVLRKLEDKQPINTKQEILTKKTNEKARVIPVPPSTDVIKSKTLSEAIPIERSPPELPLPTISVTNIESLTTNKAPLENIIDESDKLIVPKRSFSFPDNKTYTPMRLNSEKHFVDAINISPKETQTDIIYVGKSMASVSITEEVQTSAEAVDTKQHTQEEPAGNKAKVDAGTFQTSTEAEDTKQHAQEEPASNKAKVDSDTFQYSSEPVDTKKHAQEESASNKAKVDSDTSLHNTGAVDTKQLTQEDSASNKVKVDPDTRSLCSQRDHKFATGDRDENTIPIVYQGDGGTINIKLDIKIQNIVNSCQKNCQGVRSVTNIMRSEKESQISIVDNFLLRCDSFNSLFHTNYSQGYGFDISPNVMVVQCAGCGRLKNPPGCDPPQCCDNNKKYFVLLKNSVNEDLDESCNCNPQCRPSDLRQTQLKRQSSVIPVKKTCSDVTLDTITTVTVSGIPLQNWEMKKCNVKNSSCQTEETHDCMISKHSVSITEELGTNPTSEAQKKSSSSSVVLTAKRSRLKLVEEICPEINEYEGSVCSQIDPVPSACIKESSHICPKVQSMGCQQTCPPVQTQGCSPVSSTCPTHPVPLACIQIQTHVSPHGPHVSNTETQTQWKNLVLQARRHCDGRYSFHLPPLNVLNKLPF